MKNRPNQFLEAIEAFGDTLVRMRNVDGMFTNIDLHLGDFGAEKEWNDDPEKAQKLFLHTKSYKDFSKPNSLILLGRTGTGKTAILRCLYDKIKRNASSEYSMAVIVPFDEILENLLQINSNFLDASTPKYVKDIIARHINCYVMRALIKRYNLTAKSKMYSYIKNAGLYNDGDESFIPGGINKFSEMFKAGLDVAEGTVKTTISGLYTAMQMAEVFSKFGYHEALIEMNNYLKNENVLVLVDTLNEYDLRNEGIVTSVKALISVCFDYYVNLKQNHICIKISIPSEIHTHIVEALPGKQQGNTVVIQWSNNDLIKMIALRLLRYGKEVQPGLFPSFQKYTYEDFYEGSNATENAKKLIYEILPKECPTSLDYTFDTIAYCIRHTLKKPREVILIFSTFVEYILQKNDSNVFFGNPNSIRDVIHSAQEDTISQALSMYVQSYKGIRDACDIVLHNRRYCFLGKELDAGHKEASVKREGYGIPEIKRILLESGLVGKVNNISNMHISPSSRCLTDNGVTELRENSIQIVKAKFEYQVKGRLSLNRDELYVIHPMCYEHYECELGQHTLVYPDQFEDDAEIMSSVRLKDRT